MFKKNANTIHKNASLDIQILKNIENEMCAYYLFERRQESIIMCKTILMKKRSQVIN